MIDYRLIPPDVTTEQLEAMKILDERGLEFCVHFGYKNAVEVLWAMDVAMLENRLYEWMLKQLGDRNNNYSARPYM